MDSIWVNGWGVECTADGHFLLQLLICWEYDHRAQERTLLSTTTFLPTSHIKYFYRPQLQTVSGELVTLEEYLNNRH